MSKKPFYLRKLRRDSKYIKIIKKLYGMAGVKYRIYWKTRRYKYGRFDRINKKIELFAKDKTVTQFLSAAFHELGHFYCTKKGIYKYYHTQRRFKNKNDLRKYKATALKAEKYCDRIGYGLMKKYFPKVPYYAVYFVEENIDHWKKTVLKNIF